MVAGCFIWWVGLADVDAVLAVRVNRNRPVRTVVGEGVRVQQRSAMNQAPRQSDRDRVGDGEDDQDKGDGPEDAHTVTGPLIDPYLMKN